MIQPEIKDISVEDMRRYGFGSYLNGGGAFPNNNKHSTPADWIELAEKMYQASIDDSLDGSTIPTMWGTDAVHGHNNVIGATLFPHNIGLGAANNPALIEKIAQITATEVMVTGIDWVFAPTVATVRDDRWGRTYEGYSEDPEIVKSYASSIVQGLQGHAINADFLGDNRVISTVKHFIGDGGTEKGDDQGNNLATEQALFDIHGQGYVGGLTAGAQSVMASFNRWHGDKIHGNHYLLTEVLKNKMGKNKMGFDGFVVGDWNGHGQIAGCSNENCPQAINAGLDIFMVPTGAWKPLMENTIEQVNTGVIPITRVDDAVSRILRVKLRAGLFEKLSPAKRKLSGKTALIGNEAHREVARQAVRESLVLLKNKNNSLPISPKSNVLITGDAANNIGKQSGGWTITWQGTNNSNEDFPAGTSIYDGLEQQINAAGGHVELSNDGSYTQKPDVAIVVFGEEPYAEGVGDRDNLVYQQSEKKDLTLLRSLKKQGIPVISVFISGRPMWVNPELNASDAFVAAWLPGSEGKAIADVLLTDAKGNIQHDFKGKLSFSWPKTPTQIVNRFDENYDPLLPYGFGLKYGDKNILSDNLSEILSESSQDKTTKYDDANIVNIFRGKTLAPWNMVLFSEEKELDITSSTSVLAGISYRTIDKLVQEDAFKLEMTGRQTVGVKFIAQNSLSDGVLKKLQSSKGLKIAIKRLSQLSTPVLISIGCNILEYESCTSIIDISKKLNEFPINNWDDVVINSQCLFKEPYIVPNLPLNLTLQSEGRMAIAISDVAFVSNLENYDVINCN